MNQLSMTAQPSIQPASAPSRCAFGVWLPILAFSILWADLLRQLSYQWQARDEYAYGWFVPILAVGLWLRKWDTRPPARPSPLTGWLTGVIVLAAVALLPIRIFHEANPDWASFAWPMAFSVVTLTWIAIYRAGGSAWWRHFAFPAAFILVAITWPYRIESTLTQGLMRTAAAVTVEILGWLNVPALRHGNLIELSTGTVGVDEACSGIRSFQSSFMAALYLGEHFLLRFAPRIALLVLGLTIAFSLNIVRTLFLTAQAATSGLEAIDKWHDPAGLTILVVTFACLWGLASIATKRLGWAASPPAQPLGKNERAPARMPSRYLIAMGCWGLVVVICVELWYRPQDRRGAYSDQWTVSLPTDADAFEPIELTPRVLESLQHPDAVITGRWTEPGGIHWNVFFLRWDPASLPSIMKARWHHPEVCLPGSGFREVENRGLERIDAGAAQFAFHRFVFEANGRHYYVFFCQWHGDGSQQGLRLVDREERLDWVRTGRRRLGLQTLQVILTGYASAEHAEEALRERLPALIRLNSDIVDEPVPAPNTAPGPVENAR